MARVRDLKLPRGKLPEPLANALRLYGYNWQGRRSREGKLWTIYRYGKPGKKTQDVDQWTLNADASPEVVVKWLVWMESGGWAPAENLSAPA